MSQTSTKQNSFGSVVLERVCSRPDNNYRYFGNEYRQLTNNLREYIPYYYPFGSTLPTRSWSDASRAYRYGFNGKEKDSEGMGGGNSTYDYGFRIYNSNLGRFLSVDPLLKEYPWYTTYQFAGNTPIQAIDLDGLEEYKVILYLQDDKVRAKIIKVTADGPLKILYYSANMAPAHYGEDNPVGYKETFIKEKNSWETEEEEKSSIFLRNGNKDVFILDPNNHLLDPKTIIPTKKAKPKTATFRGHVIGRGAKFKEPWTPFFTPTSPPSTTASGGGGSAYEPGQISNEGKKFFKDLISKVKSISGVKELEVTIKINVGSVTELSYFNNTTAKNIKKNVEAQFRKAGIKVKVNVSTVKNPSDAGIFVEIR